MESDSIPSADRPWQNDVGGEAIQKVLSTTAHVGDGRTEIFPFAEGREFASGVRNDTWRDSLSLGYLCVRPSLAAQSCLNMRKFITKLECLSISPPIVGKSQS